MKNLTKYKGIIFFAFVFAIVCFFLSGFSVSAEESSSGYAYTYTVDELRHNMYGNYYNCHYSLSIDSQYPLAAYLTNSDSHNAYFARYDGKSVSYLGSVSARVNEYEMIENTGVGGGFPNYAVGSQIQLSTITESYARCAWSSHNKEDNVYSVCDIPIFATFEEAEHYLLTGDYSNVLNEFDVIPNDTERFDSKYNLKGFECNDSVLATWTGATNPTLVSDENSEVSEYVAIYADYGKFTSHLDTVLLSELKYNKPYSELVKSGFPLESLVFVPIYSQTNGIFGNWFYGNKITVDFDEDGSITNIDNPLVDYGDLKDDKPLPDGFVDLDFNDTGNNFLTDFKLENFHADFYINAEWTSVHIPNKLQKWMDKGTIDMDDIGLMVMFTYKNRQYPETDSYKKYYPRLLKVADLKATINVADYQPVDNKYYLSDVSFVPIVSFTYYNSSMGTSMKPIEALYYGSMSHVHFNDDGSPNGADFNDGDINGDSDGGWSIGKDDYGEGIITGDISDLDVSLKNVFGMLQGMISSLGSFPVWIASIFGFLPPWALVILGLAVVICVICRVAGR